MDCLLWRGLWRRVPDRSSGAGVLRVGGCDCLRASVKLGALPVCFGSRIPGGGSTVPLAAASSPAAVPTLLVGSTSAWEPGGVLRWAGAAVSGC